MSKEELISYIREVKEKLDSVKTSRKSPARVPVTTAQLFSAWEANLDVAREVDFVVAHFYPFWDGEPVSEAGATLFRNYDRLKADLKKRLGRDIEVVIGETGGRPPEVLKRTQSRAPLTRSDSCMNSC